jgi:hypothetical protein
MKDIPRLRRLVLGVLLVGALVSSTLAFLMGSSARDGLLNLGTEFVGAAATYYLFELVIERRERREAEKEATETRKKQLIAEMGSRVNDVAVAAAEELVRQDWQVTYLMETADLAGANLSGAWLVTFNLRQTNLEYANLKGASLMGANLMDADLDSAILEGAMLSAANLSRASLEHANLKDASLTWSKLKYASLRGADMSGASLERSNVSNEQLKEALTLAGAILPDGTQLSEDNWEAEFEEWREKQEELEG